MKDLQQGDADVIPSALGRIATAHTVSAIPVLKAKFASIQNPHDKAHIANVLIGLGDKDPVYWDFLLRQAIADIENDAPPLMTFDAQGKLVASDEPPPAFAAWAQAHHQTPRLQLRRAYSGLLWTSSSSPRSAIREPSQPSAVASLPQTSICR